MRPGPPVLGCSFKSTALAPSLLGGPAAETHSPSRCGVCTCHSTPLRAGARFETCKTKFSPTGWNGTMPSDYVRKKPQIDLDMMRSAVKEAKRWIRSHRTEKGVPWKMIAQPYADGGITPRMEDGGRLMNSKESLFRIARASCPRWGANLTRPWGSGPSAWPVWASPRLWGSSGRKPRALPAA